MFTGAEIAWLAKLVGHVLEKKYDTTNCWIRGFEKHYAKSVDIFNSYIFWNNKQNLITDF